MTLVQHLRKKYIKDGNPVIYKRVLQLDGDALYIFSRDNVAVGGKEAIYIAVYLLVVVLAYEPFEVSGFEIVKGAVVVAEDAPLSVCVKEPAAFVVMVNELGEKEPNSSALRSHLTSTKIVPSLSFTNSKSARISWYLFILNLTDPITTTQIIR